MYRAPSGAPRVQRRHGAVGLGPRRPERRRQRRRPQHAAGDGQPVRRHGRAAVRAPAGAGGGLAVDGHDARRRRRSTRRPRASPTAPRSRSPAPRPTPAAASSPASRSRPTAARPGIRATGTTSWSYTWIAHGAPSTTIKVARDRRQRQHRDARRRRARSMSAARARCGDRTIAPPATPTPATRAGRGRRQVPLGHVRHRSPGSASTSPPRTPAPTSAACGPASGAAPRAGDLHRRDGDWLADRDVRRAGRGAARTRRTSRRTTRPTATTRRPPSTSTARRRPAQRRRDRRQRRRCTRCATRARRRTASTATARQRVPRQLLPRRQLLGRRDVLADAARPARSRTSSAAEAGRTSANVSWTAPASGGTVTSYKITPYVGVDGADAEDGHRLAARDQHDDDRPDDRARRTRFTVQAMNPTGAGAGVGAVERGDAGRARRAGGAAPTSSAQPASAVRARDAGRRPAPTATARSPGYTVTPYVGGTAQTPVQVGAAATSATVAGLTNGTSLHVPGDRDQRRRDEPALGAVGARRRRRRRSSTSPRRRSSTSGDRTPVELGVKFRADYDGSVTGVRFYKAAGNTGTHIGSLWTAGGQRLAQATFTRRDRVRLAVRDVREPGGRSRPARPTSPPTSRPTAATPLTVGGLASGRGPGRCTRSPTRPARTACTPTARRARSRRAATTPRTTGSTCCTRCRRRARSTDVTARSRRPTSATGVVVAARERRAGELLPDHAVRRRRRAQTAEDRDAAPPATSTRSAGLTSGTTYTFAVRRVNANGAGADVGAVERGHAAGGRSRRRRRRRWPRSPATSRARVSWDRAEQRRRQPDHGLHGHAVRRRDRAGARPGRAVGDERHAHRAHERHRATRSGSRRPTPSARAPTSAASARGDAAGDDLRLRDAVGGGRRRRRRGRARREVPRRRSTARSTGIRFYKAGRQHRHPRRQPVDGRRPATRERDVHGRDRVRLADA